MNKESILETLLAVFPEERRAIEKLYSFSGVSYPEIRLFILTDCSCIATLVKILEMMENNNYPTSRFFNIRFSNGRRMDVYKLTDIGRYEGHRVTDITTWWEFH